MVLPPGVIGPLTVGAITFLSETDDKIMAAVYILLAIIVYCTVSAVVLVNRIRKDMTEAGKIVQAMRDPANTVRMDATAKDN